MLATRGRSRILVGLILGTALLVPSSHLRAADKAKGTLTYKSPKKTFTVALNHAYLVKGPDTFEKDKTVRRLVLSTADFAGTIQGAQALNGFDGDFKEGMIIDLVDGPRYNYWVVLNNQLVQYSGTIEPALLKSTTDTQDHLAGKIGFDQSGAGGAKIDVTFDATLLKTFAKAR